MAAVFPLANYESVGVILAGTGKTAIVTVPTNFWYDVTAVRVNLGTGSAGNCALTWSDASESVEYVLNDAGVFVAGIPYDEECMPLHMEVGDVLYAKAAANNHVIVTFVRGSRNPENRG